MLTQNGVPSKDIDEFVKMHKEEISALEVAMQTEQFMSYKTFRAGGAATAGSDSSVFPMDAEELAQLTAASKRDSQKGRMSVRLQWMNEFSDMGFDTSIRKALILARGKSDLLDHEALHIEPDAESSGQKSSGGSSAAVSQSKRSSRRLVRSDSLHVSDLQKYEK